MVPCRTCSAAALPLPPDGWALPLFTKFLAAFNLSTIIWGSTLQHRPTAILWAQLLFDAQH